MMMKNKIYESFEAIDNDLKILKLEKFPAPKEQV